MIKIEQITDKALFKIFFSEGIYYLDIETNKIGQPEKGLQIELTKAQFSALCEDMEVLKCRYNG